MTKLTRTEFLARRAALTQAKTRQKIKLTQEDLDKQKAAFLKKGGKIQEIPTGVGTMDALSAKFHNGDYEVEV